MLPTPSTSHVNTDIIYEPAEDSFLLLDTLSSPTETSFLTQRFRPQKSFASTASHTSPLVVEIGVGSGIVISFVTAYAQHIFGRSDILTLGTDVNTFAAKAAAETVRKALHYRDTTGHVVKCNRTTGLPYLSSCVADLTSFLVNGTVDVLLFNPPYVPTDEIPEYIQQEKKNTDRSRDCNDESDLITLSWAGGVQGMEVTNRLLEQIQSVLSPERGVAYVLLCSQNKPLNVRDRVRSWGIHWSAEIVGSSGKTAGWEKLVVLRIARL